MPLLRRWASLGWRKAVEVVIEKRHSVAEAGRWQPSSVIAAVVAGEGSCL